MDKTVKIPTLIALPLAAAYVGAYQLSYETVTVTVEDKNTVFDQNAAPDEGYAPQNWLIYTPSEVFKVSANWTHGEFSAAERYHALKVGQTYSVRVAGWRVPALNWYRDIVEIEPAAS